ncbi:MAG: hypothetical protein ACLRT5_18905 [Lachnospiraceae bacterium]|jgi:hypothetical protein
MCTVKEIREAIREDCHSQHDMESTDIDQVLQSLPFSEHDSPFSQLPKHKHFYRPWQNKKNS